MFRQQRSELELEIGLLNFQFALAVPTQSSNEAFLFSRHQRFARTRFSVVLVGKDGLALGRLAQSVDLRLDLSENAFKIKNFSQYFAPLRIGSLKMISLWLHVLSVSKQDLVGFCTFCTYI